MSSLSRCTTAHEAPKVLPPLTLLKVIVVMAVLLSFGLAHLSLRFHLSKILRETNQLQMLQSTLASEVKALQGHAAALTQDKRLLEYGRYELGMVPYRTDSEPKTLRVSDDVYHRYEVARANLGDSKAPARQGSEGQWLDKFSDRIGLIGQAVAGEQAQDPRLAELTAEPVKAKAKSKTKTASASVKTRVKAQAEK